MRWLGHVCRMHDSRMPKDILYGELATGTRSTGRPSLRFRDASKRDLKYCNINPAEREKASADRPSWRANIQTGISRLRRGERSSAGKERAANSQCSPMRVTPPPLLVRSIQGGFRPYAVRKGPVRSTQQFR